MTFAKTMPINDISVNAWEYALPKSITQLYGKVGLQFYITNADGEVLTTAQSSFMVSKGVEDVTPAPDIDIYEEIMQSLAEIQEKIENGLQAKIKDYDDNNTYYQGDAVYYNGNIYIAKSETIDHLPTDTTYWKDGSSGKASLLNENTFTQPNTFLGGISTPKINNVDFDDFATTEYVDEKIEELKNSPDVVDIVQVYNNSNLPSPKPTDLVHYNTATLGNNDIVRVLQDETHNNTSTFYKWNKTTETWAYIGSTGEMYTKEQVNALLSAKLDKSDRNDYCLYAHTPTDDTTVLYAVSALQGDIPQRTTNGNIIGPEVSKITNGNYYATKEYVDNKYLLLNIADEIQIGGIDGAFCPDLTSAQISQIYTAYTQGKKVRVQTTTDTRRYYDVLICNDFSCTLLAQRGYIIEYFSFGGEVSIETHSTIVNKDLNAQGLYTGNSYYRHIGTTTTNFKQGVIYFYSNGTFKAIDGSGGSADMTLKVYTTEVMNTSTLPSIQ
ncbi:MAG: hypothetical protein KBS91_00130, partial [Firmicutes bacterium]|nr:hypothetical protein [Candidatus Caballimonas caccae]